MSKSVGKYPAGAIRQHHSLATGGSLNKANTSNKGGGFTTKQEPVGKGAFSSSGDTGGPRGGSVPDSTMTPA
jgi:hypothetical protein